MRKLMLTLALFSASLVGLAATPSQAAAQWRRWGAGYYSYPSYYYPGAYTYGYPSYYTPYYSSYYYAPAYSSYYYTPSYRSYYYAPSYGYYYPSVYAYPW
jgi:hypothetical protein